MTNRVANDVPATSRFTRSVNLQRDLWQPEALRGYLVTAGARRALLRIAPARLAADVACAWTLTGPYGTGKSAFGLFTAALLASDVVPAHAAAWKLLRSTDRICAAVKTFPEDAPGFAADRHHRRARTAAARDPPRVAGGDRSPTQQALFPRRRTN